jgi:hypothetical protein
MHQKKDASKLNDHSLVGDSKTTSSLELKKTSIVLPIISKKDNDNNNNNTYNPNWNVDAETAEKRNAKHVLLGERQLSDLRR